MFQTFQTGISEETYDELRHILEQQNGHAYTLEEAKEIGDGLVSFFMLLIELEGGREHVNEGSWNSESSN